MSQVFVERVIGLLATDEGLRSSFEKDPAAVIEAMVESDEQKNQLCPPVKYWDRNEDYLRAFLAMLILDRLRAAHPAVASWSNTSRLNPISSIAFHLGDLRVSESRDRIKRYGAAAVDNLQKLLSER